ncbi:N-acetylmuramoyl-L-alanine amidase LytC precursor [Halobacillus karajensis]|uniref:N-acetylmuramoyl-L-alanine amidase LytC n=2 Tax=Halobacillus karajensis TaxID=195088 RepID=A0A059NYD1_9BACI|nr:N-acetylmuramoyl-L-alanine amidase LytC precursor [Halobacillus karajensis]CDQ22992.1 N-acetylmuramoyl-L-alanine amidase LytC precursor [Halobacillus karajensis]CDQ26474.1 N-acetylmuramoyl-L-alanine amidase LytC precursor [Halobacillus karajensis]
MSNMSKKWIYGGFGFLIFLVAVFIPQGKASAFHDVPEKYETEIHYLIDRGIIKGYPNGNFGPDDPVTREQAATMVGRALGLDGRQRNTVFPEVDASSYASGYIQSAYEEGIITGFTDGTYRPKKAMTRGGMAYLISKAFSLEEQSSVWYSDVSRSGSQYEAINKITTAGIANGYSDGTFRPTQSITRTEFSLLLARGMNDSFKVSQEEGVIEERVTTDVLNVRSGPSTSYTRIGQLAKGAVLQVHEVQGDWLKMTAGSLKGYVHKDYTVRKTSGSRVIAIDPGHGGKDGGAEFNGLVEKEINLNVSKRLRDYLENSGVEVIMTRTDDTFIPLDDRNSYAVSQGADTFVSIHANAFSDPSANGTETYYSSQSLRVTDSKQLATFIQKRLVEALGTSDRGVKDVPYRVIKETTIPSTLVELGFMTNDSDASKLGSSYWRDKAAKGISQGILDYYEWKGK